MREERGTFSIRSCQKEDIPEVIRLIHAVQDAMTEEQKAWFFVEEDSETREKMISGRMFGFFAVEETSGKTAAVFTVDIPGNSSENLGREIGLQEDQFSLVAHMDTAAVLPEYRGNHLQVLLMQTAEQELKERGYRYLMCTVHPENPYSLHNVLRQGYQVVAEKEKYGGLRRNILLKQLG